MSGETATAAVGCHGTPWIVAGRLWRQVENSWVATPLIGDASGRELFGCAQGRLWGRLSDGILFSVDESVPSIQLHANFGVGEDLARDGVEMMYIRGGDVRLRDGEAYLTANNKLFQYRENNWRKVEDLPPAPTEFPNARWVDPISDSQKIAYAVMSMTLSRPLDIPRFFASGWLTLLLFVFGGTLSILINGWFKFLLADLPTDLRRVIDPDSSKRRRAQKRELMELVDVIVVIGALPPILGQPWNEVYRPSHLLFLLFAPVIFEVLEHSNALLRAWPRWKYDTALSRGDLGSAERWIRWGGATSLERTELRGRLLLAREDWAGAERLLSDGLVKRGGSRKVLARICSHYAEALTKLGRPDDAWRVLVATAAAWPRERQPLEALRKFAAESLTNETLEARLAQLASAAE